LSVIGDNVKLLNQKAIEHKMRCPDCKGELNSVQHNGFGDTEKSSSYIMHCPKCEYDWAFPKLWRYAINCPDIFKPRDQTNFDVDTKCLQCGNFVDEDMEMCAECITENTEVPVVPDKEFKELDEILYMDES